MAMPEPTPRFRPYTRPKDGPRRPALGYTIGAWWFNVSHLPGSLWRRMMRPVSRALSPSPGVASPWWSGLLAFALVLAAVAGVAALVVLKPKVVTSPQGVNHTAVGTQVTEWSLASLNQLGALAKAEQSRSKVTIIHYWRLGHKNSLASLPPIAKLHQRHRGSNQFSTLTIVTQTPSEADETIAEADQTSAFRRRVMDLLSERNLDLPVYDDAEGGLTKSLKAVGAFQGSFPTTLVLDKEGRIQGVWNEYPVGQIDQISTLVQRLLTR